MCEIVELFSDEDLARLRRQIRRRWAAHGLLAIVALAACVVMIARTDTANAARMELATIIVSTLAGWIVIYGTLFVVVPRQRELRHAMMLRSEARQEVSGAVTVTGAQVAIRKSITARGVEVRGDTETQNLLVCQTRADALAASGATKLYIAHGYVAAYEVPR